MTPITNYPDYYVNELGDIFSTKNKSLKKLKLSKNQHGYLCVVFSYKSKQINLRVHRLVAETFIPNFNSYPCVNHIDGNKLNNRKENLEWCTVSQNTKHAYKKGLIDKNTGPRKRINLSNETKKEIFERYNSETISFKKLGKSYNLHHTQISRIIRSMRWVK